MKAALVVAGACALIAFPLAREAMASGAFRKDRAAVMIYEGRDRVISIVPNADSANIALIMLTQWTGRDVHKAELAGRPCVGVALFSKWDWGRLMAAGRAPDDVLPTETPLRLRLYAATGMMPAAIEDITAGKAWEAVGLDPQHLSKTPAAVAAFAAWSIPNRMKAAKGPCTVE